MDSRQTFVFRRPWNWHYLLHPHHYCRIFVNGVLISDIKNGETITFTLPSVPLYLIGISESKEANFPCIHSCICAPSDNVPIDLTVRINPAFTWYTKWECTSDYRKNLPLIERLNSLYVLPKDEEVSDTERTLLLCNEFLLDAVDGIHEVLQNSRLNEILIALDTVGDTTFSQFLHFFFNEQSNISAFPIPEHYITFIMAGFEEASSREWYSSVFPKLPTLYRYMIEYLLAHL